MRIAYIAPYQGPSLLKSRPTILNRSLSGGLKMELIAALLRENGHQVEIISQGEVVENTCRFYPSFTEPEPLRSNTPVHYASALPVPRLNGFWSNSRTLRLFKARHSASPYDLVLIWNLKGPQVVCANHAIRRLGLPVILEYEDDQFVDRDGQPISGWLAKYRLGVCGRLLKTVSGCMAVSPHLLSQLPDDIPKLLLRGVVAEDLIAASRRFSGPKKNVILFSGTHGRSNGVVELIQAWRLTRIPDWELHITGHGALTEELKTAAQGVPGVIFHGLVTRQELVALMSSAAICINPHAVSRTPGHLFAFKLIEYLAAGAHVITTPMGALEKTLEAGMTYMPDNSPETTSATLQQVIRDRSHGRTAMDEAQGLYGPKAVAKSVDALVTQVRAEGSSRVAPWARLSSSRQSVNS